MSDLLIYVKGRSYIRTVKIINKEEKICTKVSSELRHIRRLLFCFVLRVLLLSKLKKKDNI